jgi:DNA primase
MKSPRILLAALAAAFLSTAIGASAQAPTANQVTVPPGSGGAGGGHAKLQALFDNQQEFLMFRMQMHQATKGMSKDQKKAYRKQQIQQIKVMNDGQKAQWRQGLQAQWNALPDTQKNRIEQKLAAREARHQTRNAPQGGPSGQGYMDPDSGPDGSPQ